MDRTSRIGIFVCLGLLLYIWIYTAPPPMKPRPVAAAAAPAPSPAESRSPVAEATSLTPAPAAPPPEQIAYLENDFVRVTFTSVGAAIRQIELKQHKDGDKSNIILNEHSHSNVFQLTGWPGAGNAAFTAQSGPGTLAYSGDLPDGLKWTRTYALGKDYKLDVTDTLSNPGGAPVDLPAYGLSVGRAEPLRVSGHYQRNLNFSLGCGWLTDKFRQTTINDFAPSSFFGMTQRSARFSIWSEELDQTFWQWTGVERKFHTPLKWIGAEDQFFTVLLAPNDKRLMPFAQFECFNPRDAEGNVVPRDAEPDIEGIGWFSGFTVPAGQAVALGYTLYAGPKEYGRLNALGDQQGEMMNYGAFSLLIVPMLAVLHFFYGLLGNYGVAIILLTLCVKICTWPLQGYSFASGKRMQALAPKMKELQAKYKDQPEKVSAETMKLYKEYGVNPAASCLPALIQMPVFFSLYFMLQNAVELRGQHFLWVHDLTQPDTIFSMTLPFVIPILNFSHLIINPLPILVTGLTMVMMRMTPQMGDPAQQKVAQFMPLIFLFIFYNFAAGLSLYYVINNCVSVIQIYRNLKKPLPELKRVAKK
jgi:YidC/Oxa1 family membrane protein insertase